MQTVDDTHLEASLKDLDQQGFCLIEGIFAEHEIVEMIRALPDLGERAGTRSLLDYSVGQTCAKDPRVRQLVTAAIGEEAQAVRGILFDKSPGVNWNLGWHQDTKIAVKEQLDVPGYLAWSTKEGVIHCQPPVEVLQNSVAVRIHLDDCGEDNGPLRVIPGSHRHGFFEDHTLAEPKTLTCRAGDVILMKPLTLHASSKSEAPTHRRVIHIEFCSVHLDGGLRWAHVIE